MKLTARTSSLLNILIMIFIVSLIASASAEDQAIQVIKITAKKFEYSPNVINIKKGIPVILEFTSLDRLHGFNCPDLGIRVDIFPGKIAQVRILPDKAGTYEFHCDVFCGEGHEGMTGTIVVE
jgi:cytochrome c oxidase subunit II